MALSDWLAGIGGGAAAIDQAKTDDEKRQLEEKRIAANESATQIRADVQRMIAELNAGSRERVAAGHDETKVNTTDSTNQTRNTIAGLNEVGRTNRLNTSESGRNRRADQSNATTMRGQDMGDNHYWDSSARLYDNMFTTDATRRRGQDMSQATAERGQDLGADTADTSRRARNALGVLGLRARSKPSVFSAGDPTDYAKEFDKLYNDPTAAAGEAVDAATDGPAADASAAPPVATAPPARPRVPVTPRLSSAAPGSAAPAPPALPKGLVSGATVRLKSGQTVTVDVVNPDGTFTYK